MKFKLTKRQQKKWVKNLLKFTAPVLAVLFYQLSQGVKIQTAFPVAMYACYALLADYFKKLK